ncbi:MULTISPECIES: ABC transporter ATP-binding protein [unclassified Sinorhizobium]|uniref:ABC transporter ATP-binding protein n=1 Tax=unclassified Sinorhizobium TaxID=2613772 RepID=UPI0035265BA5
MSDPKFLSIEGVNKKYATRDGEVVVALDDLSIDARHGEFISIVGPSGCGKSTLMMMVAGLAKPTSGQITVDGVEVTKPQTQLGIVFQEANLLEWRTILQNLMLQAEIRGLDRNRYTERAKELLDRVGLGAFANRMPFELSGGMQQRASICRAVLHDPPLLLMDEPFGALDAMTRDDLNLELQDIWMSSPKTVLFVTHSISEAVFLSDRVIVMSPRPGRVAAQLDINLPRPRDLSIRETPEFGRYTSKIRDIFTSLGVMRDRPSRTEQKVRN